MPIEVQIDRKSAEDLAILARKLKTLGNGRTIPAEFRKALRTGAQPAAKDAKVAARSLPAGRGITPRRRSDGRVPLRRAIANAISVQVRLGGDPRVSIRVSKKSLGNRANLPRLINRGEWPHPTFGHEPIVHQRGLLNWYDDVMRRDAPYVRKEIEDVLKEFERRLMRG